MCTLCACMLAFGTSLCPFAVAAGPPLLLQVGQQSVCCENDDDDGDDCDSWSLLLPPTITTTSNPNPAAAPCCSTTTLSLESLKDQICNWPGRISIQSLPRRWRASHHVAWPTAMASSPALGSWISLSISRDESTRSLHILSKGMSKAQVSETRLQS